MSTRGERGRGKGEDQGSRGSSGSRGGQPSRGTSPGPAGGRGASIPQGERRDRVIPQKGRASGRGSVSKTPESVLAPPEEAAECDARIQTIDTGVVTLNQIFSASRDAKNPVRPGFGTAGSEILVRANFFALKFREGLIIHDYGVEISPKSDSGRLKGKILRALENAPQFATYKTSVAHDGSQRLVSAIELPQPLVIEQVSVEDDGGQPESTPKQYTITLTKTGEWNTKELSRHVNGEPESRNVDIAPLISALNLVVQKDAAHKGIRVGKNRYFFEPPIQLISGGVEAWRGYFASVRPVWKSMMVNLNVCMTAFVEAKNLGEAIKEYMSKSAGHFPDFGEMFGKPALRVKTRHLGYRKTVRAITTMKPGDSETEFYCEELRKNVTVKEYFESKYPNHPFDPDGPVVDIGSQKKPTYVPVDLCDIVSGIPFRGRLSRQQTRKMLSAARNTPQDNAVSIREHGFQSFDLLSPHETMKAFGLAVDAKMTVVPARILPPPGITYANGQSISTEDGAWNIRKSKFYTGADIDHWAVMVVQDSSRPPPWKTTTDPKLASFINRFKQKCISTGMSITGGDPAVVETPILQQYDKRKDPSRSAALNEIKKVMENLANAIPRPRFILVLLCHEDHYIYPGIKRIGDVELGIHTVCMQVYTAHDPRVPNQKREDQYLSNVALKVNTKLGGVNHKLDHESMQWLVEKRTMVVGADVTHPSPASMDGTPSLAAVVASIDAEFVHFLVSMRLQDTKEEMITSFKEMMVERLQLYQQKNEGLLPERVLLFRDGVSEGQFDLVLSEELPLIQEAFNEVYAGASDRPKLMICICGKRHHARFYPTDDNKTSKGNTKPGTIIDKGVGDVYRFDFFLQAHQGIQGTVKATHYTVVYDEIGFDADVLQKGTHTSSYAYARATRAVSLCPPAYYSDLACERGRLYLNDFYNLGVTMAGSAKGSKKDREELRKDIFDRCVQAWGVGVHPNLRDSMFYI